MSPAPPLNFAWGQKVRNLASRVAFAALWFRNKAPPEIYRVNHNKASAAPPPISSSFDTHQSAQLWGLTIQNAHWNTSDVTEIRAGKMCWIINSSAMHCPTLLKLSTLVLRGPRGESRERLTGRAASSGNAALIAAFLSFIILWSATMPLLRRATAKL